MKKLYNAFVFIFFLIAVPVSLMSIGQKFINDKIVFHKIRIFNSNTVKYLSFLGVCSKEFCSFKGKNKSFQLDIQPNGAIHFIEHGSPEDSIILLETFYPMNICRQPNYQEYLNSILVSNEPNLSDQLQKFLGINSLLGLKMNCELVAKFLQTYFYNQSNLIQEPSLKSGKTLTKLFVLGAISFLIGLLALFIFYRPRKR